MRERDNSKGAAEGEGEADSLLSRNPDMGLDPRTLGPRPELKADTLLTEPPRCPQKLLILMKSQKIIFTFVSL